MSEHVHRWIRRIDEDNGMAYSTCDDCHLTIGEGADSMSETKVVVPAEMLEDAIECCLHLPIDGPDGIGETVIKTALEAALRWLSEHPIVPTDDQMVEFRKDWESDRWGKTQDGKGDFFAWCLTEWPRRMFRAADPEVPEAVKDLISCPLGVEEEELQRWRVLEAYRRGQKSQTGS